MSGIRLVALALFPPVTFMMATYDGSLGALVIVTLALLVTWILGLSKRSAAAAQPRRTTDPSA